MRSTGSSVGWQARGIHDLQGEPVHLHRLVEGVPGRARHLGHDRPLPSHQSVQQARLAHVWTPHDHHPEPFAEQVAAGRGPPRRRHRGPDRPSEPLGEQRLGQVRDFLVGEVEGPLDEGADLDELGHRRVHPIGERAVERAPGEPGRLVRRRVDEVRHRLGLGEIELAVEERPFGELAGPGRAGAEGEHPAGHPVEDHRPPWPWSSSVSSPV